MSNPLLRRETPMWDLVVEAHELPRRRVNGEQIGVYVIERLEYRTGGTKNEAQARRWAVREAHRRAGVPPWRPYVRESMGHARVSRYMLQLV